MNETQLFDRIRQRHPAPAWAVLRHVRNQTGYRKGRIRTADAMALSLYPSNGLCLHGFETKVSASDLRKELYDPTKSAEFSEYCDYWWLVLGSEDLMNGTQIPEAWGVLAPRGKSLYAVKKAPKLSPKPLDMGIVCGIIRKASEVTDDLLKGMVPAADVRKLVAEQVAADGDKAMKYLQEKYIELKKTITEFEESSGLNISNRWQNKSVVAAIKYVMEQGMESIVKEAQADERRTRKYLQGIEDFLKDVDSVDQSEAA